MCACDSHVPKTMWNISVDIWFRSQSHITFARTPRQPDTRIWPKVYIYHTWQELFPIPKISLCLLINRKLWKALVFRLTATAISAPYMSFCFCSDRSAKISGFIFCLLVVFFCELKQNTLIWRTRKLKTFVFSLCCSLNCIMCVQCVLQRSPYISLIIPFRTAESGKNIIRKKAINFIGFSGFLFSSVHREYKHTTRYTIFPIFH